MPKKKQTTPEVEVTSNEEQTTPKVSQSKGSIAFVYDKNKRLMRTYTKAEHGDTFAKKAHDLASQPRRDGWTVFVR